MIDLEKYNKILNKLDTIKLNGKVSKIVGLLIESQGPSTFVGELCYIHPIGNYETIEAEVIGFRKDQVLLMPLGSMEGIGPGCEVIATGETLKIAVDKRLLGRVLDGCGKPMDGKGNISNPEKMYSIMRKPPNPLMRKIISEPLQLGVRAIDTLLTIGKGQRVGIFAGSGVGKSTLLGMIARNTKADINVIALVGERGREVREFIEKDLSEEGLKRSIVVCATSDVPALVRIKAAFTATAVAEFFRDKGYDVTLMMDSVTRFALAQREVGLAAGEPPAQKGFTPSVFALLPQLLERSGTSDKGTITGLYTVLVEGDDMDEPVADAVRGILDGHIVLSRKLAHKNHYPAIDILQSISRLMTSITTKEHQKITNKLKDLLAEYKEAEDLINIGAYSEGQNKKIDEAIKRIDDINDFCKQGVNENVDYEDSKETLINMF